MATSDDKANGKSETYTEKEKRLTRKEYQQLAERLSNGLKHLTAEQFDGLAGSMADSFLDDPDGPFQEIEERDKRRFLRAYAVTGVIARSARICGVDRTIVYSEAWANDEQFQEAMRIAEMAGADSLIDEAWRRGVEGVEKPVGWYMGKPGGTIREYSDNMLSKLLHASAKGEKFRDRVDVRSTNITIDAEMLDRLPPPVVAAIAQGTPPAVAITEYVGRIAGSRQAASLPPGRDVSTDNESNHERE